MLSKILKLNELSFKLEGHSQTAFPPHPEKIDTSSPDRVSAESLGYIRHFADRTSHGYSCSHMNIHQGNVLHSISPMLTEDHFEDRNLEDSSLGF